MTSLSAIVIVLGLLIFIHEAGHFIVGKVCGIAVETFSIGFGPVILERKIKHTSYRISLIPLGGFVKFFGSTRFEDVPSHAVGKEFFSASPARKMATVAAGPVANFLLAGITYAVIAWHGIPHPPARVGEIIQDSPAALAGLRYGDTITKINGTTIDHWDDLREIIAASPEEQLTLTITRGETLSSMEITPEAHTIAALVGGQKTIGRIGITPTYADSTITVTDSNGYAASMGIQTGDKVVSIIKNPQQQVDIDGWRQFTEIYRELFHTREAFTVVVRSQHGDYTKLLMEPERSPELALPEKLGIRDSQLTIKKFTEYGAKQNHVLQSGDIVLAWNDTKISTTIQLNKIYEDSTEPTATLTILRNNLQKVVHVDLEPNTIQKPEGKATLYTLPVEFLVTYKQPEPVIESYGFFSGLSYGAAETYEKTALFAHAIVELFRGELSLGVLGGPIGIAKVASETIKLGWLSYLSFLAIISVNLGIVNLIPIPMLDGGQLALIGVETALGKPVSPKAIENYSRIGLAMIFSLIILTTYNDIGRYWEEIFRELSGQPK